MNKTTAEDFIIEPKREYTYYESDGSTSSDETNTACAFVVVLDNSDQYFVKFFRSRPFDPNGVDANKINSIKAEYKKVAKETFDLYVKYLSTNRQEFFFRAERKCLDG